MTNILIIRCLLFCSCWLPFYKEKGGTGLAMEM